ncbi:MAG: ATP-binding protein [Desulfosarcina sp.]|nr:ATP-binding protein [Desulfobacterales bacterium]
MAKITFKLKNRLTDLDVLCDHLASFCDTCGISKKQKFEINLALDELFTNIINHGFDENDKEHNICVTCANNEKIVEITIRDDGVPFNPLQAPQPDFKCTVSDREIGGLGIHLIKAYIDRIDYRRDADQNVLKLTKILKD